MTIKKYEIERKPETITKSKSNKTARLSYRTAWRFFCSFSLSSARVLIEKIVEIVVSSFGTRLEKVMRDFRVARLMLKSWFTIRFDRKRMNLFFSYYLFSFFLFFSLAIFRVFFGVTLPCVFNFKPITYRPSLSLKRGLTYPICRLRVLANSSLSSFFFVTARLWRGIRRLNRFGNPDRSFYLKRDFSLARSRSCVRDFTPLPYIVLKLFLLRLVYSSCSPPQYRISTFQRASPCSACAG